MLKIYHDISLRFIVFQDLRNNDVYLVVCNGSSEEVVHAEMKRMILNTLKNPNLRQLAAGYINLTNRDICYRTDSTAPVCPKDDDKATELIDAIREKLIELDIFELVRKVMKEMGFDVSW